MTLVRTVALVTQSAAIVTGGTDALVEAGVCAASTRGDLVTAVTPVSTQLRTLAYVLMNVVTDVKIYIHISTHRRRKCLNQLATTWDYTAQPTVYRYSGPVFPQQINFPLI